MPLPVKKVQLQLKDDQNYKDGDLLFNVDAEAWARGTRSSQNVSTTDPTYHNNAAWYATQANNSASAAAQAVLTGNLAQTYIPTKRYFSGEYVIQNGTLYQCVVTTPTGGETWTEDHWRATTAGVDIKDLKKVFEKSTGNIILNNWEFGKSIDTTASPVDLSGETAIELSTWAYQIIDCTQGDTFMLTGTANNAHYRLWCWCDDNGVIKSRPVSNLEYKDKIIICPAQATKLLINVNIKFDYSIYKGLNIDDRIENLNKKYENIIDPDNFEGTDSEKIQMAMSAIGDSNHGIILIKRAYTLTKSINISHDVDVNNRIIFMGVGNDSGFIMGPYRFKSLTQTKSYGMISFENLYFTGTGVLFASEYLLRVTFFNCTFQGGTNAVRNNRYMQSWTFNLCTFRDFSAYVIYSILPTVEGENVAIYDVTFNQCLIEKCKGFMYTNKLIGVSIMQCCIEGLTGPVCTVVRQARSLSVIGNYFEYNNCRIPNPDYETDPTQPQYIGNGGAGVHFDFTRLVGNLSTITIANNNFVTSVYSPDTVHTIILLPPNKPKIGYIIIRDNDLSYGSDRYLVKAHDNATDIYTNVLLSGNTNDAYDGGPNNLLINLNKSNIGNINYIQDNSQLSNLAWPGFYYASENTNITDRPAEGELFIINLRCNDGKAQLAITNEGIKTRINEGAWI